ncbi:nuclear transport factor 2 family protein [Aspergillus mulundensis]|uniref:SnoaL-like domain-containing protein n=1 Tax=Aspergillus mulundensis TaxID=1810919 RepID=A0A3D8RFP0_9EURO|nr:Uncharacterized protein DSM5745_07853 [Aspergillus mulundensis]RDW72681.1 Uncharacterized protein DSM5745_07853 [Aspergillus mulundensis]
MSIPTLPARLNPALTGRDAIIDALSRFLISLDTADEALFTSSIAETASLTINGDTTSGLGDILKLRFSLIGGLDTTHHATNLRINISEDGKTAQAVGTLLSQHYRSGEGMAGPGKESMLLGNLIGVEFVKDEDEGEGEFWRIQSFVLQSNWAEGVWDVLKA